MISLLLRTLEGMRRNAALHLSAVGAGAATALLVGLAAIAAMNATRLTSHWGEGTHLVALLRPDVSEDRCEELRARLAERPEVAAVRLVTPRTAWKRLLRGMGARAVGLDDIGPNALPASLEIRLHATQQTHQPAIVAVLQSSAEVEQIDHLGRWAERLGALSRIVRAGFVILALLVAGAGLYIIASATRIGMLTRADEIAVQRLIGADSRFINRPLLLEGLFQGLSASAIALALLYALFRIAAPRISEALGPVLAGIELRFLSPLQAGIGLIIGGCVGLLGSLLALGRGQS
jgi:cell division transport system permease protein